MINLESLVTKEDKEQAVKQAHMRDIDAARDIDLNAGFEWNGMMFDSDKKSIQRISGMATLSLLNPSFETDYITQDNIIIHLSSSEIASLAEAAAAHEAHHVFKARQAKDALLNNQ